MHYLSVSLGFFDDITIQAENLQHPSRFDEAEHVWIWEYQTDEGKHDLFMDTGEEIRFRVVAEFFSDTTPTGPSTESTEISSDSKENKHTPYLIMVS